MNHELNQEITYTSLIRFTMPSIIMMVVMSLYTVVDGTFVSNFAGTDAFSAVNIIYPLSSITIALGTMFGSGMAAIVSRKLGEGKAQEANELLSFIIVFTIILGIGFSILCFIFIDPIIQLLGANEAIFAYCKAYALPLIFFFTANILQFQFQSLFIANGKPKLGLYSTIAGGLCNVILDYVFIVVLDMGISGAALATGIGYMLPSLFGIYYFSKHKEASLHFTKPKKHWSMLLQAAINGSSEMVSYLSASVTTFLFNIIMMNLIGSDGVAAIAILLYLDFILIAISLGFALGSAPLISYNYGSGNVERLKKLFRISMQLCVATGILMSVGTFLCSHQLAAIFAPVESNVYTLATAGLHIYAFSYLFKGLNIFSSAFFTAFGNGAVSAAISFLRTLVFLVASLLGLSYLFGVDGVWFSVPVAELLAAIVSLYFLIRYRKTYHYTS